MAAATSALLVGLCSVGVLASFLLCFFLMAFWMAFLPWPMLGLSSPLPLLVQKRCSSPPCLTLLSTSLDAGLSSAELMICCAVECVRGGVHCGVAYDFALRPVMVALATALEQLHAQ